MKIKTKNNIKEYDKIRKYDFVNRVILASIGNITKISNTELFKKNIVEIKMNINGVEYDYFDFINRFEECFYSELEVKVKEIIRSNFSGLKDFIEYFQDEIEVKVKEITGNSIKKEYNLE